MKIPARPTPDHKVDLVYVERTMSLKTLSDWGCRIGNWQSGDSTLCVLKPFWIEGVTDSILLGRPTSPRPKENYGFDGEAICRLMRVDLESRTSRQRARIWSLGKDFVIRQKGFKLCKRQKRLFSSTNPAILLTLH